ncbi:hypothetical protein ABMB44_14655 [Levilactobacillus brevis]
MKHEQAWYHQEIDRILHEKLAEIQPEALKKIHYCPTKSTAS